MLENDPEQDRLQKLQALYAGWQQSFIDRLAAGADRALLAEAMLTVAVLNRAQVFGEVDTARSLSITAGFLTKRAAQPEHPEAQRH